MTHVSIYLHYISRISLKNILGGPLSSTVRFTLHSPISSAYYINPYMQYIVKILYLTFNNEIPRYSNILIYLFLSAQKVDKTVPSIVIDLVLFRCFKFLGIISEAYLRAIHLHHIYIIPQ